MVNTRIQLEIPHVKTALLGSRRVGQPGQLVMTVPPTSYRSRLVVFIPCRWIFFALEVNLWTYIVTVFIMPLLAVLHVLMVNPLQASCMALIQQEPALTCYLVRWVIMTRVSYQAGTVPLVQGVTMHHQMLPEVNVRHARI